MTTTSGASSRRRSAALLLATLAAFAAWVFLHLPATWAAEGIINRVGFQTYEQSLIGVALVLVTLTFATIWLLEGSFTSPVARTALFLLPFGIFGDIALMVAPVEHVHFPQYALIALLIGLAGVPAEVTWLAATGLGAVDEAYQLLFLRSGRPDYFDWNDVVLNAIGAAYGVALLLAGSSRPWQLTFSSRRVVVHLLAAAVLGLLLAPPSVSPFISETPRGVQYRILSAFEGVVLLGALWWTLRRMLVNRLRSPLPPPLQGHGDPENPASLPPA